VILKATIALSAMISVSIAILTYCWHYIVAVPTPISCLACFTIQFPVFIILRQAITIFALAYGVSIIPTLSASYSIASSTLMWASLAIAILIQNHRRVAQGAFIIHTVHTI
jgi:hypothetical protein